MDLKRFIAYAASVWCLVLTALPAIGSTTELGRLGEQWIITDPIATRRLHIGLGADLAGNTYTGMYTCDSAYVDAVAASESWADQVFSWNRAVDDTAALSFARYFDVGGHIQSLRRENIQIYGMRQLTAQDPRPIYGSVDRAPDNLPRAHDCSSVRG